MRRGAQRGQAIVLVAMILTVLFGFVGLAMDGGRGYLDRRHVQASVDAAALAAAYNYMAPRRLGPPRRGAGAWRHTPERRNPRPRGLRRATRTTCRRVRA